ncbi:MAG TPA: methyltransferase domain-containing protein [Opitutaceae bacterium]|jgi:ubiquinone/menaquinone biosynthesis C-methylase UbiE
MRLWQVQRHWDELAKADPLWAVLTDADKQGKRWTVEEFYATGVAEVEADLARIGQLDPGHRRRNALDFGCGAGRLTQALAAHFKSVVGVDISHRMIELARRHSPNPRVAFVQSARPDLKEFAGGSFDLVYSRITLQHIAPRYTRRYLKEFVRILAPGGLAWIQVPSSIPPGDPPERFQFSLWPPTVWMRVKRYLRYHYPGWFPGTPKMQMFSMSRAEVEACLVESGAVVLSVERSPADGFENLVYAARKPSPETGASPHSGREAGR